MKKLHFFLITLFGILSNNIFPQTDSLANNEANLSKRSLGMELGTCQKGMILGLDYTFINSKGVGGSFGYNLNIAKSKDVPSDYYSTGLRVFAPRDFLTLVWFDLVKEFLASNHTTRFGIELGPSWIRYNVAKIEINPHYNPNGWFYNFDPNKYTKSHVASNTIGLNLKAKVEFPALDFCGVEIGAFTNLNSSHSVIGLKFCVNFGNYSK
jgi:hypothetical protein